MSTNPDVTGLNLHSLAPTRRVSPLRMAPNLLTLMRICLAPFLVMAGLSVVAMVLYLRINANQRLLTA